MIGEDARELRAELEAVTVEVRHLGADVHDRLAPAWGDLVTRVERVERRVRDLETVAELGDISGLIRRVEILERSRV